MSEEFLDAAGRSPFGRWFGQLPAPAAAKVTTALYRLDQVNVSNVKSVGHGVHELRIHFGPGYRVYFGMDGETLVILLAGGSKTGQPPDIADAHRRWAEYKQRKRTLR
jgi:putative addiction module killer protein